MTALVSRGKRAWTFTAKDVTLLVPEFGVMVHTEATGVAPGVPLSGVACGVANKSHLRTVHAALTDCGLGSLGVAPAVDWAAAVLAVAVRSADAIGALRSGQAPGLEALSNACKAPVAALHLPSQSIVTVVLTLGTLTMGATRGVCNVTVEMFL